MAEHQDDDHHRGHRRGHPAHHHHLRLDRVIFIKFSIFYLLNIYKRDC